MNDLITKQDRVYIPVSTCFGNIIKKGSILGVKESYAVLDDTGKRSIYIGKNKCQFVYTETSRNCLGEEVSCPTDAYTIIKSEYPRCTKFFSKFYDMTLDERNALIESWPNLTKTKKDAIVKSKK